MKKIAVAVLLLLNLNVKAQDLSMDLPGFFVSRYSLMFEMPVNPSNAFDINGSFTNRLLFISGANSDYAENSFGAQYKYYLSPEKSADGYFVGAYVKYRSSKYKDVALADLDPTTFAHSTEKTDVSTSGMAAGILNGFKWTTSRRFFMELDLGIGKFITNDVKYSNSKTEDGSVDAKNYIPYFGNKSGIDGILSLRIGARLGKL